MSCCSTRMSLVTLLLPWPARETISDVAGFTLLVTVVLAALPASAAATLAALTIVEAVQLRVIAGGLVKHPPA